MHPSYQLLGSIDELPTDLVVDGYDWLSNSPRPVFVDGQSIQHSWFRQLPFVVEANFYAEKEGISLQVKNIDGSYSVRQFNLRELPEKCHERQYLLDATNDQRYLMVEAWHEDTDDHLEGMSTFVPAWSAFKGFIK